MCSVLNPITHIVCQTNMYEGLELGWQLRPYRSFKVEREKQSEAGVVPSSSLGKLS